jgi:hypothetical protein
MPFGGTVGVRAMKDDDYVAQIFPGTTVGLQAAIDYLAGGKGKVKIGPGTLLTTTAIWLHSGCHLQGCGIGQTIIKRSTMANGDATQSGCVLGTSPFGSNGTINTSGTTGTDITIMDMTVDGNYASFGAVTQANLVPAGVRVTYHDGVRIERVETVNCLGDGFRLDQCRNVTLSDVECDTVGQWSVVAARNGVNFIGDYAAAGNWGYNHTLSGASMKNVGDEAIQASNITLMTIMDVSVDGCDFVFEVSPASGTTAGTFTDWTISDITAVNVLDYFFAFAQGQGTGYTIQDVAIANCTISGHPTLHDGGALYVPSVTNFYVNRMTLSNCQFRQINTKDTTSHHWLDFQSPDATGFTAIRVHGCSFYGKSGSVRTGSDFGIHLRGQVSDCQISDCILVDVPGTGIRVSDGVSVQTFTDLLVSNVMVDGANDYGIRAAISTGNGTVTNLHFLNCIVKNSNKQVTGAGIQLYCDQAGGTLSKVFVRGCRVYKTAGATLTYGLDVNRLAGTIDSVTIENCDFDNTQTGWVTGGSGATNLRFLDPSTKGADVASATTLLPQRGDLFTITGVTQIDSITPFVPFDRRPITFVAGSTAQMSTGFGNLTLSGYWTPTAGDTITLRYNGSNWIEVSRSQSIFSPPGTMTLKSGASVASATNVTLPAGNYFAITGAVTINTFVTGAADNGRVVFLTFTGAPVVNDNGTAGGNIHLAGSVDFTVSANSTLTLISNTANWFELSRSVN